MKETPELETLKKKLEEEKKKLERELGSVGRKNPDNPKDWVAASPEPAGSTADPNETADRLEDFEENMATETELETQLGEVNAALERMRKGTYGVCEAGGEPIESDRLLANPAARTCKKHLG